MKRALLFVAKGPLSVALGVSQQTGQRCEEVINELIFEKKATLEQVVEHVNEHLDLNDAEWTAFAYGLGYMMAKMGK